MRRFLLPLALCFVGACPGPGAGEVGPDGGDAGVVASDGGASIDGGDADDAGGVADAGPDAGEAGALGPEDGGDAGEVGDAGDAGTPSVDGGEDGGTDGGCFLNSGVYGQCISTTACAALGSYTSTPGFCPGPADIECCAPTPNVADNPPVPTGWQLMQQSAVTPAMTTWAVAILNDPTTYPMFSTTIQTFGSLMVLARVEWHPPDFQNSAIHRGVTLYVPG